MERNSAVLALGRGLDSLNFLAAAAVAGPEDVRPVHARVVLQRAYQPPLKQLRARLAPCGSSQMLQNATVRRALRVNETCGTKPALAATALASCGQH